MIPLLKLNNIFKSFYYQGKPVEIIHDLSLSVNSEEFVTVIGPSGCGKSTLLELICGVTTPNHGVISYGGVDVTGKTGIIGYMPQDDLLLPWLSVMDNCLLPARVKGYDLRDAAKRINNLLPVFGLEQFRDYYPWQLSGGLKQRAAFLRTCGMDTALMVLDEPFANLDAITRIQMQEWLISIKDVLNKTIILVTHDIDEAVKLSQRILVMQKTPSSIIKEITIEQYHNFPTNTDEMEAVYLLKSELLSYLTI